MWPVVTHRGQTYRFLPAHKVPHELSVDARPWINTFVKKNTAGAKALGEMLEELERFGATRHDGLWERVLMECWYAHQYKQSGDHPHKIWIAKVQDARRRANKLSEQSAALRENVEKFIVGHPDRADFLTNNAFESIFGHKPKPFKSDTLISLLKGLENEFGNSVSPLRLWIACLDYGFPVEARNVPVDEARTGLEFALALRFRHVTGAEGRDPLEIIDCTMPSDGEPHYELVALLTKATLENARYRNDDTLTDDAKQIGRRLTKLRHRLREKIKDKARPREKVNPKAETITYVGWPVRV